MIKVKIDTNKTLDSVLKELANEVYLDTTYIFLPFLFEYTDDGVFAYHISYLPLDLKYFIELNNTDSAQ